MKKILSILLCLALVLGLAGCGGSKKSEAENEAPFEWTRTGYFLDESEENMVYISVSEDEENPGWSVGCMLADGTMHGWYLQQEGKTLHGNIVAPYEGTEDTFVVTVSEEGEDGIVFEVENGETYHLKSYEMPQAAFAVYVNTEGMGEIAYGEGEQTPEFDDEYPYQSAYVGLEGPEVYTFAARPEEGWKFMKWTYNGSDYSTDPVVTFEVVEDTDLVAVFGIAGTNEAYVDLDSVTTIGELLGLPDYGYGFGNGEYVYAFEQDGNIYRAFAQLPEDVENALFDLDWDDEEYDQKKLALISDLPVVSIDNLTEGIPTQEQMDKLIGKTGEELLSNDWYSSGWNLDDMIFYMSHGPYQYQMVMEGYTGDPYDFNDEDINPLVVKSVKFDSIGDPTSLEDSGL